ncbi:MAG TPA: ABC transporter substrate-binding protein [Salinivirgaceae bacterium]|mgnify:FL=1|nr:ABC transporter substrate-binding protein [Salinivirgaceae bacterium]HQA76273.1 ABC transporter substrate-binding protein [Salinivirgaceae bacterium]
MLLENRKHKTIGFKSQTIVALFAIFLLSYSCKNSNTSVYKIFRYNESKGIPTLDPAFARNQTIIWPTSNIFNGLVQLDNQLHVKPDIATYWESSNDKLTHTFYLRTDVYFHEHELFGKERTRKVTAQDFVYSFNRIIDPATSSPGAWIFANTDKNFGLNGFYALNDSVLQIKLTKPFVPFVAMLAMPYCMVVPKEAIDFLGDIFGQNPIGTGPFSFALWDLNNKLILKRNPIYFECDSLGNQLPYLDAIHISFIADKQSEFMEFLLGKIDFISGINATNKDELLTRDGQLRQKHHDKFYLQTYPYLNTEYLGFNLDSTISGYVEKEVREALNYAFNRERMVVFLRNNLAIPANVSLTPPILYPKGSKQPEGYEFNQEKAINILKNAGYGTSKELKPITLTTTPDYLDIAEFFQHQAKQIGVKIVIETATGAAFRQKVANGDLPFFRASWIADYPHAENYLSLFYSKNLTPAGPNYTKFISPEYDLLYQQISTNEQFEHLIPKADSIVMSEAAVIPLFYDVVVRVVNKRVSNLPINALNAISLKRTMICDE